MLASAGIDRVLHSAGLPLILQTSREGGHQSQPLVGGLEFTSVPRSLNAWTLALSIPSFLAVTVLDPLAWAQGYLGAGKIYRRHG